MRARQTIPPVSKWLILGFALFFDIWGLLFGMLAILPIFGAAFSVLVLLGSIMWTGILSSWLFLMGLGKRRLVWRLVVLLGLEGASLLISFVPVIGGIIDMFLMFFETFLLYLLIRSVEKEDEEYNKEQGLT